MAGRLTDEMLEAADCLLAHDVVAGDAHMTEFRRRTRHHHARWRQKRGFPIGASSVRPGTPVRPIGSELDLEFAVETGATFLSPRARAAADHRMATIEPNQRVNRRTFWADLMSSEALAINLFADLAADHDRATKAVQAWWPGTPGRVREVRFLHSPGRSDPTFSNSLRSFDACFVLERSDGTRGALAVDVTYREVTERRAVKPTHMPRFGEIHDRSGVFTSDALAQVNPSRVSMLWLEHVLLLSMLQHVSGEWSWGRYVVVHPQGNHDIAAASAQYRSLLADDASFGTSTIEDLLTAEVLPARTASAIRGRYLPRGAARSMTPADPRPPTA
ncbi:MAG: hypothetical protein AAGA90_01855 [Actinomycetota bacterium]